MARNLTRAQVERRTAILGRLTGVTPSVVTADEVREYLARKHHIFVTVDTVQRDLRAMAEAGTVQRTKHPTAGHEWGGGRRITYTGWVAASKGRYG